MCAREKTVFHFETSFFNWRTEEAIFGLVTVKQLARVSKQNFSLSLTQFLRTKKSFGLTDVSDLGNVLATIITSAIIICSPFYVGLLADIWSCGIIFYAIICGFLPFDDSNT